MKRFIASAFVRAIRLACAVAAILLAASPAAFADPIVIKFSHVVAPETPKGRAAEKFRELAGKYTEGRVKVEVYPDSQLYQDKEELEALQLGAVQMLAMSLAKFGPLGLREFEVFDLPYIFPDKAALRRVTEGPIGKALLARLEDRGVKGLAYWDNGFKIMTANRPLNAPGDFRGLRMRIQASKTLETQMKALGATPEVMAFSEAFQALQSGVIDGTENTPSNIYTQKMFEVQKYGTLSYHGYLGYVVIVNKKFWDELPGGVQKGLNKALDEATEYADDMAEKDNDEALLKMKESGKIEFHEMTPEERAGWKLAFRPVYDEAAAWVGRDLLERVMTATGAGK